MGASGLPNPITIEAIFTMADHLLLDRDEVLFFVQGLDETFMEEVAAKRKPELDRGKGKGRRGGIQS